MTATREVIAGRQIPSAIGPYSPAVRAGEYLFVSGQPGVDPRSAEPAGPTFSEQARQAFRNLDAVLRAGGSRPELVVNTTVLVADASAFTELNDFYAEFFPSQPPARMTMQVPLPRGLLFSTHCCGAGGRVPDKVAPRHPSRTTRSALLDRPRLLQSQDTAEVRRRESGHPPGRMQPPLSRSLWRPTNASSARVGQIDTDAFVERCAESGRRLRLDKSHPAPIGGVDAADPQVASACAGVSRTGDPRPGTAEASTEDSVSGFGVAAQRGVRLLAFSPCRGGIVSMCPDLSASRPTRRSATGNRRSEGCATPLRACLSCSRRG